MYAFIYSIIIDPLLRDIRSYVPKFSEMKSGDVVLDVCCGTGAQVFCYAGMGIVSTGIDLEQRMITFAEKNRKRQGLENVSFQRASALDMPFKDNSFDSASICMSLHEKPREARDLIITEMKRVVKNEGALVFIDFQTSFPRDIYSFISRIMERIAGREHFRCFRDYIEQGGLDELLSRNKLQEQKRAHLRKGPIVLIKTINV